MKKEHIYNDIINFINNYYSDYGYSPNTREISLGINVPKTTVQRYLQDLKNSGMITYGEHRNISIIKSFNQNSCNKTIPVAGRICCGNFNFATETELENVVLPQDLIGPGNFFALQAVGDSMIDAGISNGDIVILKKQCTATPGQIVSVLYESTYSTLKRFLIKDNKIILHPENSNMNDIIISGSDRENLLIQGVATMVIKSLL